MKLNYLVNAIGMLSVVAGLVFVGLEMRQAHEIALAAQQQSRTEIFTDLVNSLNESSEASLYQLFMKVRQKEILTEPEKKLLRIMRFCGCRFLKVTFSISSWPNN